MKPLGWSDTVLVRILALGAALSLAALYALFASSEPATALRAFFVSPFSSRYSLFTLLEATSPLLVCALGAGIAFRAGAFNLGGEGQAALGSLGAALAIRAFGDGTAFSPALVVPAALAAAAAAGALLALLSALAERWSGAEVLLTSFLLSQAALVLVDWAVGGPLKESSSNLLAMPPIPAMYRLPRLAPPSSLSLAAPLALLLAVAAAFFTGKTRWGYELGLYGRNRAFSQAVGIGPGHGTTALGASGALSGLAGGLLVLGATGRAVQGMTGGVGWNGLAVALVTGSKPLGAVPAALFFAWLDAGSRQASIIADLSPDASSVMKAVAIFFITARLSGDRLRMVLVPGRVLRNVRTRGGADRSPRGKAR